MSQEIHVVIGSGQVGSVLAENLLAEGKKVRVVKRRASGAPKNAELVLGDAADAAFCRDAMRGAKAVYHVMNPPYDTRAWRKVLPVVMGNLIRAAGETGARLVVLDNLYALGKTGGLPMRGDSPQNPVSEKGKIRAEVSDALFRAHREGRVHAVSVRAADFYGPGGVLTGLGDYFWRPVLKGRAAPLLMNPETPHAYTYIGDVAKAMVFLGNAENDVLGKIWIAPTAQAESTRALIGRFSRIYGREIAFSVMPKALRKTLKWFVPILKEVDEMLYQWEEPFLLDDAPFRRRFGMEPTDPDVGARLTVEWAKAHYGGS